MFLQAGPLFGRKSGYQSGDCIRQGVKEGKIEDPEWRRGADRDCGLGDLATLLQAFNHMCILHELQVVITRVLILFDVDISSCRSYMNSYPLVSML